tara:strand:- start:361 stop:465 length:105 start_codon:yes stop_codon:yes gene_type:complete
LLVVANRWVSPPGQGVAKMPQKPTILIYFYKKAK